METKFNHEKIKQLIEKGLPQAHIARIVGCSRERIRQLELQYFGTTGCDRRAERNYRKLASLPDNSFVDECIARGFYVESFITDCMRKSARRVIVNGHVCNLYKMTPHMINGCQYYIVRRGREDVDFNIGTNPKGFLIMPAPVSLVLDTTISLEPRNHKHPGAHSKRHDYINYLNAWDQLKERKHENLKAS